MSCSLVNNKNEFTASKRYCQAFALQTEVMEDSKTLPDHFKQETVQWAYSSSFIDYKSFQTASRRVTF